MSLGRLLGLNTVGVVCGGGGGPVLLLLLLLLLLLVWCDLRYCDIFEVCLRDMGIVVGDMGRVMDDRRGDVIEGVNAYLVG